jgi:microcystin-dependent protein
MSYKINFTDTLANPQGITVQDQSLNNADTDLVFVGKNFPGYSQFIGENFLHLLENFARNIPPTNPIKGQLWYDTGTSSFPPKPQLKVYDGTNWTEAGNIKKNVVRPAAEISTVGDLWVDANNQQLYLFTGTTWVLVGPQFNESSSTGFRAEGIIDSATNTEKIVITFFIEEKRILIISRYEFVPKIRIEGFNVIRQGLNLSNENFNLTDAENKFWGTSEKANALVVGNATIAAGNFLRSDTVSTTGFQFNVRSSSGISVGPGLETSITSSSAGTVVHQTTPGANIILRTTQTQGTFNNSVIITADGKLGINKIPNESLDIAGNLVTSGTVRFNDILDSTSPINGSLVTAGGVGIGKNLNVGGNFSVLGQTTVGPLTEAAQAILVPRVTGLFDIGTNTRKFRQLYAETVEADVVGREDGNSTFRGNITGTSVSAGRLTSTLNFNLTGDVVSDTVAFNGTNGVTLVTSIGDAIISARPETTDSLANDQFLIYRASATPSLRKIDKATLFASVGTVPIGSIFPFAGEAVPQGYLLCDGSEQSRSFYPALFSVIGFRYRAESLLTGFQTFALPDLRGRFPIGREGMDNGNTVNVQISATSVTRNQVFEGSITASFVVNNANILNGPFQVGRTLNGTGLNTSSGPAIIASIQNNTPSSGLTTINVSCQPQTALPLTTGITISSIGITDAGGGTPVPSRVSGASALGNVGGTSSVNLTTNQLPQHTHTLTDSLGNQYYVINENTGPTPEANVTNGSIRFGSGEGFLLSNSGGISTSGSLGQPVSTINPYLTINYIIFTGRI